MKGLSNPGTRKKKRKSRLVVIEGCYVHPSGEEVLLQSDIEIIRNLELSIQETIKKLHRFETNKPKVVEVNFLAKKIFSSFINDLQQSIPPLKELDEKIYKAKQVADNKTIILLLKEKQQILFHLELKVQSCMTKLDELELEAYPKVIDRTRFFKEYHQIIEQVTKLYEQFKNKNEYASKDGIAGLMVARLKAIREDVVIYVVRDHRTVCEEFKEDEATINASQYARIITAKYNLGLMEKKFQEIINSFDGKVLFEKKVLEVDLQATALTTLHNQMSELREIYPNDSLVKKLDEVLCNKDGTLKINFNKSEFPVTVGDPLHNEQRLDHKAKEVNTAYKAMLDAIEEYRLSFDLSQNSKPTLSMLGVLEAIGYKLSIDLTCVKQAIEFLLQHSNILEDKYVHKLISFKVLSDNVLLEREKIKTYIDQWKLNFPELVITLSGGQKCFLYNRNLYQIVPVAIQYSELRAKIFKVIENGGGFEENYKKIYTDLISAQSDLTNYVLIQDQLAPQIKNITDILNELSSTIDPIPILNCGIGTLRPIEDTDRQFLNEFIRMRAELMELKNSLCVEKIAVNTQLIERYGSNYNFHLKLYQQFKRGFKTTTNMIQFFKEVLDKIDIEKLRIMELYGINDPRLNILESIEELFQARITTLRSLERTLQALLCQINPDTKEKLTSILEQIQTVQDLSIKQIKAIISDEKICQLPIAQFNPLIAWIIRLVNPLLTLLNEEYLNQKSGFFKSRTRMLSNSCENTSPNLQPNHLRY